MRVLVAMSGGVDSSVAAARLRDEGHEVVGVTMKLWGGESDTGCCSVSDVDDARRVAQQLDIEHHVFNFGDEFDRHVVSPYVEDHRVGRTPNPCIECNRHLKFDKLLRRADALDFDVVATGHHARIVQDDDSTLRLARGVDAAKDQSYVLYTMTQAELARTRFPIGGTDKAAIRDEAARRGLRTATKPDSQDVCFISRASGRASFLGSRLATHPGRVVDREGRDVGGVDAVELVTIGQRKGLRTAGASHRSFVVDVDVAARLVTVGDERDLLRSAVHLTAVTWSAQPVDGRLTAQCSAHGDAGAAAVELVDDGLVVRWAEPRRRVAPGQSVVLYDRDRVVGGGIATA
jgi:tRNA-specific 2-thiouridylase